MRRERVVFPGVALDLNPPSSPEIPVKYGTVLLSYLSDCQTFFYHTRTLESSPGCIASPVPRIRSSPDDASFVWRTFELLRWRVGRRIFPASPAAKNLVPAQTRPIPRRNPRQNIFERRSSGLWMAGRRSMNLLASVCAGTVMAVGAVTLPARAQPIAAHVVQVQGIDAPLIQVSDLLRGDDAPYRGAYVGPPEPVPMATTPSSSPPTKFRASCANRAFPSSARCSGAAGSTPSRC